MCRSSFKSSCIVTNLPLKVNKRPYSWRCQSYRDIPFFLFFLVHFLLSNMALSSAKRASFLSSLLLITTTSFLVAKGFDISRSDNVRHVTLLHLIASSLLSLSNDSSSRKTSQRFVKSSLTKPLIVIMARIRTAPPMRMLYIHRGPCQRTARCVISLCL